MTSESVIPQEVKTTLLSYDDKQVCEQKIVGVAQGP